MVRPIQFFTIVLLSLSLISTYAVEFAGGTGEPNDPFLIATAEQLIGLGEDPNLYDRHFKLIADIDLAPDLPGGRIYREAPIAALDVSSRGVYFGGTFDGNHHVIHNLTISGQAYLGLFGGIRRGARIMDLHLENLWVRGAGTNVGGLTGESNAAHVSGCSTSGLVFGGSGVGGLIGLHYQGRISRCTSSSAVMGNRRVGGLVGSMPSGHVRNCFSSGSVIGSEAIGGLVGEVTSGTLENCYSSGAVEAEHSVGGLIGRSGNGGGRGRIAVPADVLFCYSTGLVRGGSGVGGLVGDGAVQALSSFWDKETSGQTYSSGGIGATSQEMQTLATYTEAGWDFCGERAHGTADWWCMPVDGGTPRLTAFDEEGPPLLGEGTSVSPYLIADAHDLGSVARHWEPDAHYELVSDIDLSGIHWSAAVIPEFVGRFNGKGHTLSYLRITGGASLGLFGWVQADASVENIILNQATIVGTDDVGALAGLSNGRIDTCRSDGRVEGDHRVGGLVGTNQRGTLSHCRSMTRVTGTDNAGGLVGDNASGILLHSAYTGRVKGDRRVGGLAGINSGDIRECYAQGEVQGGSDSIGGLAGGNHGTLLDCYATGSVTGACAIGGLVGYNYHRVMRCYSTGPIYDDCVAGGLIGFADQSEPENVETEGSFWDLDTSGMNNSRGGLGLPTGALQTKQTFLDAGWDFEHTWTICDGAYPRLRWAGVLCVD